MTDIIRDNTDLHRFEMDVDGSAAIVTYRLNGNTMTLLHTEVPKALEGHGVGSRLARAVFDLVRQRGLRADVRCPFLKSWLERHPEFSDIKTK
jgi:predicted GNAT family acetyltransferase